MKQQQQQESNCNSSSSDLIPAGMKKNCTDAGKDIISSLPDELLHHILSSLDMDCVVKTCVLSTRWRYVWTTHPFLNFKFQRPPRLDMEEEFSERFCDFVDSVLTLRNGSANIHTFTLCFQLDGDYRRDTGLIPKWIDSATSHHVQMLDITSNQDKINSLSHEFYTSKSLRSLKISLLHYRCHLIYPSFDLQFLKHMHLEYIYLVGGEGLSNLISGCPVLETLIIVSCQLKNSSMITISSPQLKHLEIMNLEHQYDTQNPVRHCTVTLSTPNLVSFECQNTTLEDYIFVDISSLVKAHIDVGENDEFYEKHEAVKKVVECLGGLANVESLTLWLHQFFLEATFVGPECLRTTFHNLSFLRLSMWTIPELRRGEIFAIAHLLEKCPNIETFELCLVKDETRDQEELNHEDVGFPSQLVLPCLKHVKIEYPEGSDGEEELHDLKEYLEEIAVNLEDLALEAYVLSDSESESSDGDSGSDSNSNNDSDSNININNDSDNA